MFKFTHLKMILSALSPPVTEHTESTFSFTSCDTITICKNLLPIGQRPIALLDSSRSINIKFIFTAATIYLMSTAFQKLQD